MTKVMRLSKSGIEYLDYSWGIWSGCHNLQEGICPVKACWAKGLTNRYPKLYPNGFEPTFYPEALNSPKHLKKHSLISVGWVGDVIGYGSAYREQIFDTIRQCPQHTFLFLTKNSDQLIKWENFPDNCWVGVSATDAGMFASACMYLKDVRAKVKYISIEPFLGMIIGSQMDIMLMKMAGISQVIIGSQTKPTIHPKIEWVKEIVEACDKAGIPVFLKNNLKPLYKTVMPHDDEIFLRQEFPK